MKRVLISAIIGERNMETMERWLPMISSFSYPNHDILLIETTFGSSKLCSLIKRDYPEIEVQKLIWNPKDMHVFQMMCKAKGIVRQKVLDEKYHGYFNIDADEFIPINGTVEKLVKANKDCIGYPTPINEMHTAAIWTSFTLPVTYHATKDERRVNFQYPNFATFKELYAKAKEKKTDIFKVLAVGNGCLYVKRKVIKNVPYESPSQCGWIGEDYFWYQNVVAKGYEFWVHMGHIPQHFPVGWEQNGNTPGFKPVRFAFVYGNLTQEELTKGIKEEMARNNKDEEHKFDIARSR